MARALPASDLAAALDEIGIAPGWLRGDQIRAGAMTAPAAVVLSEPDYKRANLGFQNQVVGRIAERVFQRTYLMPLAQAGLTVVPYHEAGENRDFGVQRDGLELPINVKVASTKFREAQRIVHIAPDDCIPISAYKAIGATEHVPDLVYVVLVDFTLREKVDQLIGHLGGSLSILWHVMSWYGKTGATRAQNRYVDALFEQHGPALDALALADGGFHVISAAKVLAIMGKNPRRVPGLGVKGAGTGTITAEVNVHIAVSTETRPWPQVAQALLTSGVKPLLDEIRRTSTAVVKDPTL